MTAPVQTSPREAIEQLAGQWAEDRFTLADASKVFALAHASWLTREVWPLFEDLIEAVKLRDGVNEGRIDWRAVDADLTCAEPSAAAYDIACGRVDEACRALLNGRKQ